MMPSEPSNSNDLLRSSTLGVTDKDLYPEDKKSLRYSPWDAKLSSIRARTPSREPTVVSRSRGFASRPSTPMPTSSEINSSSSEASTSSRRPSDTSSTSSKSRSLSRRPSGADAITAMSSRSTTSSESEALLQKPPKPAMSLSPIWIPYSKPSFFSKSDFEKPTISGIQKISMTQKMPKENLNRLQAIPVPDVLQMTSSESSKIHDRPKTPKKKQKKRGKISVTPILMDPANSDSAHNRGPPQYDIIPVYPIGTTEPKTQSDRIFWKVGTPEYEVYRNVHPASLNKNAPWIQISSNPDVKTDQDLPRDEIPKNELSEHDKLMKRREEQVIISVHALEEITAKVQAMRKAKITEIEGKKGKEDIKKAKAYDSRQPSSSQKWDHRVDKESK